MRVLVITHGNDAIYGAATSLKLLLQNCSWDFDLVYMKTMSYNTTDENMRIYTDNKAGKVQAFFLPFMWKSVMEKVSLRIQCSYQVYRPFIFWDSFKLKKFINAGNYDYILLNSLVLFPLINKKSKYIVYVREMCVADRNLKKKLVHKLNQANRLIYIDPALKNPLHEVKTRNTVINNPFDMSGLSGISPQEIGERFPGIDTNKIIISIIGILDAVKGIDFVIDVFKKVNREDILLLIVGEGNNADYIAECKKSAVNCKNIIFLGEQKDIRYIYLMSDYILRADLYFVTGRTVYEGLYAGCNIIMQLNTEKDTELLQEYELFQDKIYFYKMRDARSLSEVIKGLSEKKISNRVYISNVEEYIRKVETFITKE